MKALIIKGEEKGTHAHTHTHTQQRPLPMIHLVSKDIYILRK